jgi:hypothetical protein
MRNPLKVALVLTLLSDAVLAEEKPTQHITKSDQHVIQQLKLNPH